MFDGLAEFALIGAFTAPSMAIGAEKRPGVTGVDVGGLAGRRPALAAEVS